VGLALFFAHGLVFIFACAIGGVFLLLRYRRPMPFVRAALPYGVLGLWCIVYLRLGVRLEPQSWGDLPPVYWGWDVYRVKYLFMPMGVLKADWLSGLLVLLMLCGPFVLGARLKRDAGALVPAIGMLLLYGLLPMHVFAANTTHIYPRFAMFFLPFYALMFGARRTSAAVSPRTTRFAGLRALWLPALCLGLLSINVERLIAFARESADFDSVLAATRPGQLALGLILQPESPAMSGASSYGNFALWYQAEKAGFVEYNFAHLAPQVVRIRTRLAEPVDRGWGAGKFDWAGFEAATYRYFFVRTMTALPERYFPTGTCAPVLLKAAGSWAVYENVNCYSGTVAQQ
jgi:hypothetical protein